MKQVREGLKKARKERKLSQADVARAVGISRTFYTQIENGDRNPSFEHTTEICKHLGIDIRDWK